VRGIASMRDMKKVGRAQGADLFQIVTTAALVIGLLVVNLLKPGVSALPTCPSRISIAPKLLRRVWRFWSSIVESEVCIGVTGYQYALDLCGFSRARTKP
jgi:Na+/H+-dicarboxylate symporter